MDGLSQSFNTINNNDGFLKELVKLSHIGIVDGEKTPEFHEKTQLLLEYLLNAHDSDLALLLTETLVHMQEHSKFYVTNNATNLKLLCNFIFIQFKRQKTEIYNHVLTLITGEDTDISRTNIDSVVKPQLSLMDANLYECFNLNMTIKLLDMYFTVDQEAFRTLFFDILTDWEKYDTQFNEDAFIRLVWFAFLLNEEDYLKRKVSDYEKLLKSDNWNVKFYRYVKKNWLSTTSFDEEKLQKAIARFKKHPLFSQKATNLIVKNITKKMSEKKITVNTDKKVTTKEEIKTNKNNIINKKEEVIDAVMQLRRLSLYNLPPGVKLQNIKHEELINLAIFENKKMEKIIKIIQVKALRTQDKKEYYVTKKILKYVKKEGKDAGGYIHIIDDSKKKNKTKEVNNKLFVWPSTEIKGTRTNQDNELGLNEMSALRKMGYQITDNTREQRWSALQRAVPAIGLKKVAYTIAGNIKLKKGQKNGMKKFSYAISEWENDLRKLKAKYYKRDFIWPST
jgi:hypothetical protein